MPSQFQIPINNPAAAEIRSNPVKYIQLVTQP